MPGILYTPGMTKKPPRIARKVVPVHFKLGQYELIARAAAKSEESASEYIRNAALARVGRTTEAAA